MANRWGVWTLVAPSELTRVGNKFQIGFERAVQINEMVNIGDVAIATASPLCLRFYADTSKPRTVNADGTANMTIAGFRFFSQERELVDPIDQKIFFMLTEYGRWVGERPTAIVNDAKQLEAIEFVWQPKETSEQGFDLIGELSYLFSRYYARQTVEEGEIIQIEAQFVPDWFGPLMSQGHKSSALPIWRFLIQPNREKSAPGSGNGA